LGVVGVLPARVLPNQVPEVLQVHGRRLTVLVALVEGPLHEAGAETERLRVPLQQLASDLPVRLSDVLQRLARLDPTLELRVGRLGLPHDVGLDLLRRGRPLDGPTGLVPVPLPGAGDAHLLGVLAPLALPLTGLALHAAIVAVADGVRQETAQLVVVPA